MNKQDLIKSAFNNKILLVLFASPMRWDPLIIFCSNCDCLANFTLPAESKEGEESPFKEITFTELEREEAAKLVEKYNKVKSEIRSNRQLISCIISPNHCRTPKRRVSGRGRTSGTNGRGACAGAWTPAETCGAWGDDSSEFHFHFGNPVVVCWPWFALGSVFWISFQNDCLNCVQFVLVET